MLGAMGVAYTASMIGAMSVVIVKEIISKVSHVTLDFITANFTFSTSSRKHGAACLIVGSPFHTSHSSRLNICQLFHPAPNPQVT
jgi:hypothetical protein